MPSQKKARIGVVDTMFARGDMGSLAVKTINDYCSENNCVAEIVRKTVPGVKDLPVAIKCLLEKEGCDMGIALGMPGREPIDKTCSHEASQGIMLVQLMTNKPVLEVFVHEEEGVDDADLATVMRNRTVKHAINAVDMLFFPEKIEAKAGSGERQGRDNAASFSL